MNSTEAYETINEYIGEIKKNALNSTLEKIHYNEESITSSTHKNFITGKLTVNYLGVKAVVYQSNFTTLCCEGSGIIYLIESKIREVFSSGTVIAIDCPDLGDLKAEKISLYRCPKYQSIEGEEVSITGSIFHNIIAKKSASLNVLEDTKEIELINCQFEGRVDLPTQFVSLIDTHCSNLFFSQGKGNVLLKGNSFITDHSSIKSLIDERHQIAASQNSENLTTLSTLKMLPEIIKKKVVGQDYAVQAAVNVIRRALLGYNDPNKPLGTLLFAGPSGVGKTQLSKEIVEQLTVILGEESVQFKRFDLAEYQQDHMLVQLIGAPRGYQDHSKGGALTAFLSQESSNGKKGIKVLLLDEFEKMHPKSRLYFLSLFDEGRVTDTNDKVIEAKQTIIIATTNLSGETISRLHGKEGFDLNDRCSQERMLELLIKEFQSVMSPELLNRFQKIIFFKPLNSDQLKRVIELKLQGFSSEIVNKKKIQITWSDQILSYLFDLCEKKRSMGVRAVETCINDLFRDLLSEKEVCGELRAGDTIRFDLLEDQIVCAVVRLQSRI